jgi:transposase
MSPECTAALERYRSLWNRAESGRASIEATKARIREQLEKLTRLDGAARKARLNYQEVLKEVGSALDEKGAPEKADLGTANANLAEAQGRLQSLQAELPKLQAQIPNAGELDATRRAAWEAIWRDLMNKLPTEIQQLVAQTYAALLAHKTDASYSMALASLFSAPPGRQECSRLTQQLAAEYSIPI